MRNVKDRVLAILMTLVMVVGLLPAGALAEGDSESFSNEPIIKEYHLMNRNSFWDYFENAVYAKASDAWGLVLNGMQIVDKNGAATWRQADAQSGNIYNVYAGRGGSTTDLIQPDEVDHITLYGTYATKWEIWVHSFSVDISWSEFKVVPHGSQSDTQAYAEVYFSGEEPQPDTIDVTFDLGYTPTDGERTFTSTVIEGSPVKEPFVQRDGYDFLSWLEEGSEETFDFSTAITAPLTLTARWEKELPPSPPEKKYTLTYEYLTPENAQAIMGDLAVGNIVTAPDNVTVPAKIEKSSTFKIPLNVPYGTGSYEDGYVFHGWYIKDGDRWLSSDYSDMIITSRPETVAYGYWTYTDPQPPVEPTKLPAWFFVRTDGLVPMENGNTGYPSNKYLPDHNTDGGLPGTVFKESSWTTNYGYVQGDMLNGEKLSKAFAEVQLAIGNQPALSDIETALASVNFDSDTQGVIWYVVKKADKGNHGCPGYHVDGVLYTKGSDPAQVRVLNYFSNIPGDKNELLAYSVHGLGTDAVIGDILPTREGYDFLGWSTTRNDSTNLLHKNDIVKMDADQTLYAQWKPKGDPQPPEELITKVEIFHFYVGGSTEDDQVRDSAAEGKLPNGGTVSRDYKGITKDYVNSLNTLDFYKDDLATRNVEYRNYTLYAYDDNGAGGDKAVVWDGTEPLDLTGVKTLRIHLNYYQTRYSVVYKANGGTGADVTKYYNTAVGYTVLDNAGAGNPNFFREDYTFSGWAKDANGTNKVNVGDTATALNKGESATYYAQWAKKEVPAPTTYGVTYEYTGTKPDGMTPPVDATKYEAGTAVTLATAPTAPANYTFNGWTLPEGVTVENGKFSMPDHAVTITGSWTYTAPSGGGGDPTPPSRYTVTVNYLNEETGASIAEPFKTALITYGSHYDVTAEAAKEIDGYAFSSMDGETSGTLRRNLTINVYYTAVEDIPDENPPLGPGPDQGETDIPEEEPPLAPLPDTGDNGGATGDDTVIEEENPPLGNLPQTGTTAQSVNPAMTLGLLALAFSMAAAGLTVSLTRKKEEEN